MALFVQSTIPDKCFEHILNLNDLLLSLSGHHPLVMSSNCPRHKRIAPQSAPISSRPDLGSQMSLDRKNFQVSVDVQQFSPEEISVKAVGNEIVVEGKHEEKKDEYGSISRHFVRRYVLPEGHRTEDVVSSLSPEGTLTITAPRRQVPASEERVVPITFTGSPQPAISSDQTPSEPKEDVAEA